MPPSLKARGGRLQAFARGFLDLQEGSGAWAKRDVHDNEHVSETSHEDALGPSRDEMMEDVRVAIPKSSRQPASSNPLEEASSGKSNALSGATQFTPEGVPLGPRDRPNSPSRQACALFEGSQLGESFMQSGISTPQNEREDQDEEELHESPNKMGMEYAASSRKDDMDRRGQGQAAFFVTEDGRMSVVGATGIQHSLSHMRDGFRNGDTGGNHRPASSRGRRPYREITIRRTNKHSGEHNVKEGHRMSCPRLQDARRQGVWRTQAPTPEIAFSDFGDDTPSNDGLADEDVTPKGGKSRALPQLDLVEGSLPSTVCSWKRPGEKRRRNPSPDYDDKALSSMRFDALQNEPFDFDPAKSAPVNGTSTAEGDALSSQLGHHRHLGLCEQQTFFSAMPASDWECSGDWFVEEFADLMRKLKDSRRERRRVIHEFEAEAARREEAVRVRSDTIEAKLRKMRQDGQRVFSGEGN